MRSTINWMLWLFSLFMFTDGHMILANVCATRAGAKDAHAQLKHMRVPPNAIGLFESARGRIDS